MCCLGPGIITGFVVYTACTTMEINNRWVYRVFLNCSAPFIAMLCILWVYFHFRFFHPLTQRLQNQSQLINNYLVMISSFVIGATMIALECIGILAMSSTFSHHANYNLKLYENQKVSDSIYYSSEEQTTRIDNGGSFYLCLFLIIFQPIFTMAFTALLLNKIDTRLKMILIPFFGSLIPIFFTLPFSFLLDLKTTTQLMLPLRNYFIFGPSGISIYF